jgi:hypothetical protein
MLILPAIGDTDTIRRRCPSPAQMAPEEEKRHQSPPLRSKITERR